MAVAYGSSTSNSNSGTTITITKPTGLSEGDMMVAVLGQTSSGDTFSLSGWTAEDTDISTDNSFTVLYKIADSGDAAASDFTFTSATSAPIIGHLYRITGDSFTDGDNINADIVSTSSLAQNPSFTSSLSPVGQSSILIMGLHVEAGTSSSTGVELSGDLTSGYAVTNNDPTWTEREAITVEGNDTNMESATATYASAQTPGDFSMDLAVDPGSDGNAIGMGYLVSVSEDTDSTFNATPLILTGTPPNPTYTADANFTADPLVVTGTLPVPTFTAQQNTEWTPDALPPDTTWTLENF